MMQTIAARVVRAAIAQAISERYPTRSVEYLLAWIMVVWSGRVLWPGDIMAGPTYRQLLVLAPEWVWGTFGVIVGALRLYALVRNGGWKRSPVTRFIGALLGLNFWLILLALYTAAVFDGAADFPFRCVFPVLMCFEGYSCYRCGQDHRAAQDKASMRGLSPAEPAGGDNGG